MKKFMFAVAVFCLAAGLKSGAFAADWPVNSSSGINNAIGSSVSGDTITVTADITMSSAMAGVNSKSLIFRNDGAPRVIYGDLNSGLNIIRSTVTIRGISFSGFQKTAADDAGRGGALRTYLNAFSSVNLSDVSFLSNRAYSGGAFYNAVRSTITVSGNFSAIGNIADTGGGAVHNEGILDMSAAGSALFENNISSGVSGGFGGGAVYNTGAIILDSATFKDNTSLKSGGAVYNANGTLNFDGDAYFSGNTANVNGGAMFFSGGAAKASFLKNAVFKNNKASSGRGGAIYMSGASGINFDSGALFENNISSKGGSALYYYASGASTFNFAGNETIFKDNIDLFGGSRVDSGGGAIFARTYGSNGAFVFDFSSGKTVFENNSSGSRGGAVLLINADGGPAVVNSLGKMTFSGAQTYFLNNKAKEFGGGIYIYIANCTNARHEVDFSQTDLTVKGNSANTGSGGFFAIDGGSSVSGNSLLKFGNAVFGGTGAGESNTAVNGGVFYIAGMNIKALFEGKSDFINNSASRLGGVFYLSMGTVSLANANFSENKANSSGGALYNTGGQAVFNINKAVFESNKAGFDGGGIYNASRANINITGDTSFLSNSAVRSGGGIYNDNRANINITGDTSFLSNSTLGTGGAIYNTTDANITFSPGKSALFENNIASGTVGGGAIYNSGTVTIDSATFKNNIARNGGAVFNNGGRSVLNLNNAVFESNKAVGADGGAVFNNNMANVNINGNLAFLSNSAASNGGAVANFANSVVTFTPGSAVLFENNIASGSYGGGAVYNAGKVTIDSATFRNNTARNGGAVYNSGSQAVFNIDNAVFESNKARTDGGALYNTGGVKVNITGNAAFSQNHAVSNGGAIYNVNNAVVESKSGSSLLFENNIARNGGAVYNTAAVIFDTVTFSGNNSTQTGGALFNGSRSLTELKHSFFEGNTSNGNAGAVYNSATMKFSSDAAFSNNKSNGSGGAVYNDGNAAVLTLNKALFENNSSSPDIASMGGGAVYNKGGARLNFTGDAVFLSNSAVGVGGAVCNAAGSVIEAGAGSSLMFENNSVSASYAAGGALANFGTASLDSASFKNNISERVGGAVYNSGNAAVLNLNTVIFNGNSSRFNDPASGGGAIYNTGGARVNFTGNASFVSNNTWGGAGGAIFNLTDGIVEGVAGSSVEFNNNISSGTVGGGAIYNLAAVIFDAVTFSNNRGLNGSAVYNKGKAAILKLKNASFIRNGLISGFMSQKGGAVYNADGAEFTITGNAKFEGNVSQKGGAVYNTAKGSKFNITGNTEFLLNTGREDGGAVYNAANAVFENLPGIPLLFKMNSTLLRGGAIVNNGATVKLDKASFIENTSDKDGGAIYNIDGGQAFFSNSVFDGNLSSDFGGAIFNSGAGSLVTLKDSTFEEGSAIKGGAIANMSGSEVNLAGINKFKNNQGVNAGAVYNGAGSVISSAGDGSSVTFESNYAFAVPGTEGGGAIVNEGMINFETAVFDSNLSDKDGGAVFNSAGGIFTLKNSSFNMNSASASGGAVFNNAAMNLNSADFKKNKSVNYGGAVYNGAGSVMAFSAGKAVFSQNNSSNVSGSASGGAIASENASLTFTDSDTLFSANNASGFAGALYSVDSNISFTRGKTEFKENRSGNSAGALYGKASEISFADGSVLFEANSSANKGGAVFLQQSTAPFSNASFINNSVTAADGKGGAVYAEDSKLDFERTALFSGNISQGGGAAVYLKDSSASFDADTKFLSNNSASGEGGAVYADGSKLRFGKTSLFSGNISQGGGAAVHLKDSSASFDEAAEFVSNASASGEGGAVFIARDANADMSKAVFRGNKAASGGAVANYGGVTFGEVSFASNAAEDNNSGKGGAVFSDQAATAAFSGPASFTENRAVSDGGALYIMQPSDVNFAKSASFTANKAESGSGGAVYSAFGGQKYIFDDSADFAGNTAAQDGGALYFANGAGAEFKGASVFDGNKAANKGGALYADGGAFVFSGDSSFKNNEAGTGGGVYISGGNISFGKADFTANKAVSASDGNGGALYSGAGATVNFGGETSFTRNEAALDGGALVASQQEVRFAKTVSFTDNKALAGRGGAVYASPLNKKYIFEDGAAFTGNIAKTHGGAIYSEETEFSFGAQADFGGNKGVNGGAAYLNKAAMVLADIARFMANSANEGGAIYAQNGSELKFNKKSHFDGNEAALNGGALYVGAGSDVSMTDPEFTHNTAGAAGGAVYMKGTAAEQAKLNIESSSDMEISGNKANGIPNVFHLEENAFLNLNITNGAVTVKDGITSKDNNTVITKTGAGTLVLDSPHNAIDGRLHIREGEVKTGYAPGSGDIYFTNGLLHLTGNVALENNMYAETPASAVAIETDSGVNAVLNGNIGNGTGNFVKKGKGRADFSGHSAANVELASVTDGELGVFSDNFTAGQTIVGAGAALGGTGVINGNVANNGTLRPGVKGSEAQMGTLTINGNYTEKGVLALRIDETLTPTNDLLIVNGNAEIASGSLIDLDLRNGFVVNSSYMVLQSNALSGIYGGFVKPLSSFDIIITSDSDKVYLKIKDVKTHYSDILGMSHNQTETAKTIDAVTARSNESEIGKISKIIGTADSLNDEDKKKVFDEVAGSIYGNALLTAARNGARRQIYNQIEEKINRDGNKRSSHIPCTYNIWGQVYGSYMAIEGDSNSVNRFGDNSGYVMAGFDNYCGEKNMILGYMAAFGRSNGKQGDDKLTLNDYKGGVYLGVFGKSWTLRASAAGGYQQYEVDRKQPLLMSETSAEYAGYTITGDIDMYYKTYESKGLKISPFVGLESSYIATDAFKEKAKGNAAAWLEVKKNDLVTADASLGLRAEKESDIIGLYAQLSGRWNLIGNKGVYEATLNGLPDTLNLYGASNGIFAGKLEGGVNANIGKHFNMFVNGALEQSERLAAYSGHLGVNYSW